MVLFAYTVYNVPKMLTYSLPPKLDKHFNIT